MPGGVLPQLFDAGNIWAPRAHARTAVGHHDLHGYAAFVMRSDPGHVEHGHSDHEHAFQRVSFAHGEHGHEEHGHDHGGKDEEREIDEEAEAHGGHEDAEAHGGHEDGDGAGGEAGANEPCPGGQKCIQPTGKKRGVFGFRVPEYKLGCDADLGGGKIMQVFDGHKADCEGCVCIPEKSPNMKIEIKDGVEAIVRDAHGEKVAIVPRYPMLHIDAQAAKHLFHGDPNAALGPAEVLDRTEWIGKFKGGVQDNYEKAMGQLHDVMKTATAKARPLPANLSKQDLAKVESGVEFSSLLSRYYSFVKEECDRVADVGSMICGKNDGCKMPNCQRGDEAEAEFGAYIAKLQEPCEGGKGVEGGCPEVNGEEAQVGKYDMRPGLLEAVTKVAGSAGEARKDVEELYPGEATQINSRLSEMDAEEAGGQEALKQEPETKHDMVGIGCLAGAFLQPQPFFRTKKEGATPCAIGATALNARRFL